MTDLGRSTGRSSRWGRWLLPVVVGATIVSLALLGRTFMLLGGEHLNTTTDLTWTANAQRQALQLEVALQRVDSEDALDHARMRLGLLQKQTSVIVNAQAPGVPRAEALEKVVVEIATINEALDHLTYLPPAQWPKIVEPLWSVADDLERGIKSIFDAEDREVRASVAREHADKRNSQVLLVVLSLLTVGMAGLLALSQRRRARATVVRAHAELTASEERFRSLVQNSSDLVLVVDRDGTLTYCSSAGERVLGRDGPCVGARLVEIAHPEDVASLQSALRRTIEGGQTESLTFRLCHADSTWRDMESTLANLIHVPSVAGIVLNVRDVTERTQLESELRHQAFHDDLTGLANRAMFVDRLGQAMDKAGGSRRTNAVLLVDLDGFKVVNDSLGHASGDALIVKVAHRIAATIGEGHTIARLGGDEFAVLVEDMEDEAQAMDVANRLIASLDAPFTLGDRSIAVTASIGAATSTHCRRDAHELLRNADLAMYVAKNLGKARVEVFEPWMLDTAIERLDFERELAHALEVDQFVVEYQPLLELASENVYGFEALVRWEHPTLGTIEPLRFIPVAEETAMIVPLGARVLEEAVMQSATWQRETGLELIISVNVSPRQLDDEGFPDLVESLLDRSGLVPGTLMLEVTEGALVTSGSRGVMALERLRGVGVRVAIDDFGTGYSSLSYLRELPVDTLKLDRSFVDGFRDGRRSLIGEAIIALCQAIGLDLIAEGIERVEQLDALRRLRCPKGQGFLFAASAPAATARQLLPTTAELPIGA